MATPLAGSGEFTQAPLDPVAVIVCWAVAVRLFESVTVNVAVYAPDAEKVCDWVWLLSVHVMSDELSLKCSRRLAIGALPCAEPAALKVTARGAVPELGDAVSCAVGPWACDPDAVMACMTLAEPPLASVMVSLTLNVP